MKAKVEITSNYIIKYNTARFSEGLEWFTEFFSINHKRELRVYRWYKEKSPNNLLIPKSYELTKKYIKIEKKLFRSSKTVSLVGNTNKAKKILKYRLKTSLDKLISIMMENDLKLEKNNY